MKRFFGLICIYVCAFFLIFPSCINVYGSEAVSSYRILCISSYNYSYSTVPDQLEGIKEGLGDTSYDIDYQFMDSKNFYNVEDVSEYKSFTKYRLDRLDRYDLLIVCDDNALRFWLQNKDDLFADMPMLFLGINNIQDAESAASAMNVTGIAEVPDYMSSFEMMHEMFPEKKNVIAVVDSSITGRGEYAQFRTVSEQYPEFNYSLFNTEDYTREGLIKQLNAIDSDSIVLYLDFFSDSSGSTYTERTASSLLYDNLSKDVPIFRVSSNFLGYGILGGIVYDHYSAGVKIGEIARHLAEGGFISDYDIIEEPITISAFDQSIMDQFNISAGDLPEGSTIINEHDSIIKFYKENTFLSNMILLVLILLVIIITILLRENTRREQLINQDFLTKMPNRLYINSKIQQAIDKREPFGILMMDVDHFKTINDTLGHPIGDELLIEVAGRLKALSSSNLLIARIGGDEFMALLLGDTVEKADMVCRDILLSIKEDYHLTTGPLQITASLGCAMYPKHSMDPSRIMNYADAALYEVKERGRDGYQIFHPDLVKHLSKL